MPRTIEHKIQLLDRAATPPPSPAQYGTIEKGENWMGNGGSHRNKFTPEKPLRSYHHQSSKGDELTYGTESFERNLRYSPNEIERQHFSTRSFGDQRSLGGGGDGESRTSFMDELPPLSPTPAEPIDHSYNNANPFDHNIHRTAEWDEGKREMGNEDEHLLHPSKHLDTTPILIPRPKLNRSGGETSSPSSKEALREHQNREFPQPLSFSSSYGPSRTSWRTSSSNYGQSSPKAKVDNVAHFPGQNVDAESCGHLSNMPMKKVIRKSRWVSIHDGRPVSKFVETVHYEPAGCQGNSMHSSNSSPMAQHSSRAQFSPEMWYSSSSCSLSSEDEAETGNRRQVTNQNHGNRHHERSQSVYVTQNPVFSSV